MVGPRNDNAPAGLGQGVVASRPFSGSCGHPKEAIRRVARKPAGSNLHAEPLLGGLQPRVNAAVGDLGCIPPHGFA